MTGEFFEDPAEIGIVVKAHCFCTFGNCGRMIFQQLDSPFYSYPKLVTVWGEPCMSLEHTDKSVFGQVAHFCIFFYVDGGIEINMHMAEDFFELLVPELAFLIFESQCAFVDQC